MNDEKGNAPQKSLLHDQQNHTMTNTPAQQNVAKQAEPSGLTICGLFKSIGNGAKWVGHEVCDYAKRVYEDLKDLSSMPSGGGPGVM
jgi:hypothetical protein